MRGPIVAALAIATLPFVSAQLSWDEAYTKAEAALTNLSLSDKVGIATGIGWQGNGGCVGNTHPVESIGYPSLCLQDGPLGVRYASSITAFTPAVQAASTWDRNLIRERGQFHAEEARALGVHVLLAPVAGALGKIAEGGRNWEGWSPDPYLTGVAVAETIEAMQAVGVQATIKHYIANEQELRRETMSSNVDDKTMHEIYLAPFYDAVKSGVAATMCSYNKLDGTWACENDHVMNELLKGQLGYQGYIMTDWGAQHSNAPAANAGLDMSMPGSNYNGGDVYWGNGGLEGAVQSGDVAEERVNDMAKRILAAWYKMGQDGEYPPLNLDLNVQGDHGANVRACARDGIVLLRNEDNILPLASPSSIAVIGSAAVKGDHANNVCVDKGCNDGALGMGWGSGSVEYSSFSEPYAAIEEKAPGAVTLSDSDDASKGAAAASGKDVALVFITADSGEGYITVEGNAGDRNNLDPWHNGNELVKAVAKVNENVIVVVHSVGAIIMDEILALPSVKAVVWAGLPSQESGNALVDVLWGETNPNGKLVYTIAKQASHYNTQVVSGDDDYEEGVMIDYRHFDSAGIEPEFEFGFGLSYTTFDYADLEVQSSATSGPIAGDIVSGGPADFFDEVATVTASVTNSGAVAGAEVAQLYLSYPESAAGQPPKQLRGFAKLPLEAGASGPVSFSIRKRDVAVWDVEGQQWTVPAGEFGVLVGASSRDIRLEGTIQVA
ncbi:glycoside hydrolase family 3 protein [Emericellopsis atlantica]|uniref:Beta-glucosidase cel3A n=1 Tax=Emericellopsis atlantica TaxID=2614577 RepID=A0A9P7ZV37_9HYPO|nr:glycoside hydrolase family 3 protein [Emericellopsis atlantica]KAG9258775.1 glycoside hydrolase family 3 protein [Emericellopsis atlantica]